MNKLSFWPIAWTLAVFSAVVFTLDVLLGVLFPNWWAMQRLYEFLLPGYMFISWGSYLLGLVEIFIGGFLTAVLFVPIYNFFAGREAVRAGATMSMAGEHQ
ncbi:MAG TPA: hypothetical protein VJK02_07930 [Anaerolineales bacterium]|jgi:hypothetical protein|nr:hypothetical protein [Anaerolineales bacterium]